MNVLLVFVIFTFTSCLAQQQRPVRLAPVVVQGTSGGASCPATEQARNAAKANIRTILQGNTSSMPQCACGGSRTWTNIASLDLSDLTQQCPPQWNLVSTPVRGCVKSSSAGRTCDSAIFSSQGETYSRVCGRVTGIQNGAPTAFSLTTAQTSIDQSYLDGVSITHGAAGSRQHIWSFVAANYESSPPQYICDCINTEAEWPFTLPSFLGNNYFCATGNDLGSSSRRAFPDDPLWDGEGCGPTNGCCEFNTPPWFCVALPQPTSDDIELRICSRDILERDETIVTLVDISVM